MAEIHKSWVTEAGTKNLLRFVDAEVRVSKDEKKGIPSDQVEKFQAAEFSLATEEDLASLWALAEASRDTYKDEDGNEKRSDNPINTLLTYAYGLTCRQRVRQNVEARFEDPDKAVRKIADLLVKTGKFKSVEKAMAFIKASQEDDSE